jgi:hypothetical protein
MAMSTALKSASVIFLGIFIAIGLSVSDAQAGQDGRAGGRGRGRGAKADTSTESRYFKICDHDKSAWISFREANHSLLFDRSQFARTDANSDGRITRPEFDMYYTEMIERAGSFKEPRHQAGTRKETVASEGPMETAPDEVVEEISEASVQELFSEHHQRAENSDSYPLPPKILGPAHHFDRLDITKDDRITIEDLEWLARPTHLEVRLSSVIAILDANNDGAVSRAEFDSAML